MTVVVTATVYCVSTVPMAVYYVGNNLVKEPTPGVFHVLFYRFAVNVLLLNVVSNFYIYTLTLSCFREFLKCRIRVVAASLGGGWGDQTAAHHRERQRLII